MVGKSQLLYVFVSNLPLGFGASIYDVNLYQLQLQSLLLSLLIVFPSFFQHVDNFFPLIPKGFFYGLNVSSQHAYVVALILTMMEFGSGSFEVWLSLDEVLWVEPPMRRRVPL